jgi:hypothetical protein
MSPDYSKRDFLLPEGCKDLIDVLNLQPHKVSPEPIKPQLLTFSAAAALSGELLIPARTTVLHLAGLLKKKPMRIILDLMEMGICASIDHELDFDTLARVVRKHGYIARKAV